MPVTRIFDALITITWSPVSMNGVYCGLFLPARIAAHLEARRPRVSPSASITCHLRSIACAVGKNVDIAQTPKRHRRTRVCPKNRLKLLKKTGVLPQENRQKE